MTYKIEKLADAPIIVDILYADHRAAVHGHANIDELLALLNAQSTPVYLIFDATTLSINLTDMLQAISMVTKQYQLFTHRSIRENILVTDKPFMKSAAAGMSKPLFGSIKVQVFETLDAALGYAHAQSDGQPA